jgi:hypothetical protein
MKSLSVLSPKATNKKLWETLKRTTRFNDYDNTFVGSLN